MRYLVLVFLAGFLLIASVSAGSLFETAPAGEIKHMEQIPEPDAGVYQRGRQNQTALHWMAFNGDEAMARRLITSGADINARVDKGSTPLHLAAYKGHIDVARILIANGARVNVRTHDGITPLDWALHNGNEEVAQLLITRGAQTGSSRAGTENTLRHSEKKLADLEHFTDLKPVLERQQPVPGPARSTSRTERQSSNEHALASHSQAVTLRVQLAALGSHERALVAWSMYRRQHPDILGNRDLIVEPVQVGGKALYRVQAGLLTKRDATSLCNELRRREQPCLVINSGS